MLNATEWNAAFSEMNITTFREYGRHSAIKNLYKMGDCGQIPEILR